MRTTRARRWSCSGRRTVISPAPDGTLKLVIEAQGGAEIYEKRGGSWQRIAYDSYFTAH